jgi:uncharacterized SAM-binding protein YcdF (DUF218 family)
MVAELVMPPAIWMVLIVLAMILIRKRQALKKIIIGFSLAMIWITSTTAFSQWFYQASDLWMHWPAPIDLIKLQEDQKMTQSKNLPQPPKAIVILGGGVRTGAIDVPNYQNQDVSSEAITRLRTGARLAKVTDLPILATGGRPDKVKPDDLPEGQLMAMVLEQELQTPVKWIEDQSNTTQENAKFSAKILKQNQIDTIYLVTHVWHMPRSKRIFEKEELKVIPVPLGYNFKDPLTPLDCFPKGDGLNKTREIWHESLGQIWYDLRF